MRKIVSNKKGAEMTIGTIIVIILALVVLVVLIVGFTQGWGSLGQWIKNLLGVGGTNLDTVISGCNLACANQMQSAYCDQIRDVTFPEKYASKGNGKYNCRALDGMEVGLEPCTAYSTCPEIKPGCKPKKNCAALDADATACGNAGCAPNSESNKCVIEGGPCAKIETGKDDCKKNPLCEWK
jgi:hypothetical protein